MNPSAKPDMECGCCPDGCDECCDCCFVRQNHIFFSICLPILCVVWIVLFVVFAVVYFPVGMILIFYIAGPVTIVTSITACCCLCFCQKRQDEQAPKPTVRNVQYVQQQRPVAQPTVQYVQPMPQQYAPQRYQPVSHAVVVQPQQYQPQPPPPPVVRMPQPAPPPPPQYVAAEATVVEAAPEGANVIEMEPVAVWRGASGWDAAGLVAALRAAPPGHKAPAVISHCMRHTEQPLPGDLALVFDSLALATEAVEVADALAKNVDLTGEAAAAAVNAAPSLARADVANCFASILSGAAKAQLVASVPGLSPRAPSKGGGFEYF